VITRTSHLVREMQHDPRVLRIVNLVIGSRGSVEP
jgi:hypothetical protein